MIAIIILLSGCRTKPSGVSRCIHFDFTQEMKDVHTMGLLKDCTIVPLETNDSVLIGEIDKVIFYETRLYVATFSPEQAVYIFNLQGKFISFFPSYFLLLCVCGVIFNIWVVH